MSKVNKICLILAIFMSSITMAGIASADSTAVVEVTAQSHGGYAGVEGTAIASDVQTYANVNAHTYGHARAGGSAYANHEDDDWPYICACDPIPLEYK